MTGLRTALLASLLFVALIVPALAQTPPAEVFYDLQPYGSGWKYTYTFKNNSVTDAYYSGVIWFNTYFPATQDAGGHYLYSNIDDTGLVQPAGWESAGINQPDVNRPDGLGGPAGEWGASIIPGTAKPAGIFAGQYLGGFSVTFNYAGVGTPPGPQKFQVKSFEIDDPNGFLWEDMTQPIAAVPSPPSIFLLAASLIGLAALRRKS